MASQTVTPVVSTAVAPEKTKEQIAAEAAEAKKQAEATAIVLDWKPATFVNNLPASMLQLDEELNAGFTLQSAVPNESDFRVGYLVDAVIAGNKATARANVASYERAIDKMAGLTCYRKTHTREAVEAAFLQTRDGKIMAEIKKCSAEYLEAHK